jgi:hypothetical protein
MIIEYSFLLPFPFVAFAGRLMAATPGDKPRRRITAVQSVWTLIYGRTYEGRPMKSMARISCTLDR